MRVEVFGSSLETSKKKDPEKYENHDFLEKYFENQKMHINKMCLVDRNGRNPREDRPLFRDDFLFIDRS